MREQVIRNDTLYMKVWDTNYENYKIEKSV